MISWILLLPALVITGNVNSTPQHIPQASKEHTQTFNCPSNNFSHFLDAFLTDTELQKTFTKFPLQQLVTVDTKPEPTQLVVLLSRSKAKFPIVPDYSQPASDSRVIHVDSVEPGIARARIVHTPTGNGVELIFEKNGCWNLIRTEDGSVFFDKSKKKEWVYKLFPVAKRCTPQSLYFDKEKRESFNHFMESQGYKLEYLGKETATYLAQGEYYGWEITRLEIPAAETSAYSLTVKTSARELAKRILSRTGKRIPILGPKDVPESGKIYITEKDSHSAVVHCFTYE